MRPSLCRAVLYTRAPGEEYAATITRVTPSSVLDIAGVSPNLEIYYDVLLAVDIIFRPDEVVTEAGHRRIYGRRWFTPGPVKFDDSATPAANTWRWPPRA